MNGWIKLNQDKVVMLCMLQHRWKDLNAALTQDGWEST